MSNFELMWVACLMVVSFLLIIAVKMLPDTPGAKRLKLAVNVVWFAFVFLALFVVERMTP